MSDALDRAVDAQLDAYRPTGTPPFAVIEARKRSRDRRRYVVAGAALSVVALAGVAFAAGTQDGAPDTARSVAGGPARTGPEAAPGLDAEQAARLCSAAAETFDGQVVGAYPTTVQAVRDYMTGPAGATGYTLSAPGPNEANPTPPSWTFEDPDTTAAACYLDGSFRTPGPPGNGPAERALVMATGGATPFLASAGPRDSITPAPLPVPMEQAVTLPTSEWTPGSDSRLASVGGVVSARRDGDTLCVVLAPSDARAADVEFTPVIWPKGYTATAYPLEIRDPDGQVVAREGQLIGFAGSGASPVQPGAPCMFGRSDAAFVMQELPPVPPSSASDGPTPATQDATPPPAPTRSEPTPDRTNFETCLGVPSDPAACTENLPGPGEDG